jgi:hypothetical protein
LVTLATLRGRGPNASAFEDIAHAGDREGALVIQDESDHSGGDELGKV